MGHPPPDTRAAPDRESFHLARAREAYASGSITLERFEELAGHVLAGGYLSERLEPSRSPTTLGGEFSRVRPDVQAFKPAAPTTRPV